MSTQDGRLLRGEQTRRAIVERAADIASAEGLEGLSIGRLATELKISKSGVFTHFGSKEELQLATVRAAVETYREHVTTPAMAVPPGLRRVRALLNAWTAYQRDLVFPGGCFFYSTAAEFDARPGAVRDAVAKAQLSWLTFIERCLREAQDLGEIEPGADLRQVAFELDALGSCGGAQALLFDDDDRFARASRAMRNRLAAITVP